jgi:hypothetical protein
MPNKRYVKRSLTFLDAEEIAALLAAPDRTTCVGRRDHVLAGAFTSIAQIVRKGSNSDKAHVEQIESSSPRNADVKADADLCRSGPESDQLTRHRNLPPFERRVLAVAPALSELAAVAKTVRARAG